MDKEERAKSKKGKKKYKILLKNIQQIKSKYTSFLPTLHFSFIYNQKKNFGLWTHHLEVKNEMQALDSTLQCSKI